MLLKTNRLGLMSTKLPRSKNRCEQVRTAKKQGSGTKRRRTSLCSKRATSCRLSFFSISIKYRSYWPRTERNLNINKRKKKK